MKEDTIYIRLRHRLQIRPNDPIYLKHIAQMICEEKYIDRLNNLKITTVKERNGTVFIIDVMEVIKKIHQVLEGIEVQPIGRTETIVEVIHKKKKVSILLFVLVWFLLFFGSALAIMYFHEDVSMRETQEILFTMITGKVESKPLLFQIPYSIGLGLGMILFFNHIFRKRLNEEPSPLEIEMFNYQQDLDRYIAFTENKENMKRVHDDRDS